MTKADPQEVETAPPGGTRMATPTERHLAYPTHGGQNAMFERSALSSKKFLGYFVSDLLWKGIIALMIITWKSGWIGQDLILAAITCSAFVQITYLATQAWVDRSVRLAQIRSQTSEH